ncbi:MAG: hypothetical protein RH917_00005 [Lacipirellulaceae bacterium]
MGKEMSDGTRAAVITGAMGIVGTLLACVTTWALGHFGPGPDPVNPPSPPSPVPQPISTDTRPDYQKLLAESPISFADWQAAVRDKFSVEQRQAIFGDEVGTRVTWLGVFDQYNAIKYGEVSGDSAYILVMFEDEKAREGVDPLKPTPALCHFSALAKRQLAQLKPGQRVVVSGRIADPDMAGQLLGTRLKECELLAVPEE